ncbi:hypothetical protein KIPB_010337, partial [Kipferlia bialata]|eukprot:g10337.t1
MPRSDGNMPRQGSALLSRRESGRMGDRERDAGPWGRADISLALSPSPSETVRAGPARTLEEVVDLVCVCLDKPMDSEFAPRVEALREASFELIRAWLDYWFETLSLSTAQIGERAFQITKLWVEGERDRMYTDPSVDQPGVGVGSEDGGYWADFSRRLGDAPGRGKAFDPRCVPVVTFGVGPLREAFALSKRIGCYDALKRYYHKTRCIQLDQLYGPRGFTLNTILRGDTDVIKAALGYVTASTFIGACVPEASTTSGPEAQYTGNAVTTLVSTLYSEMRRRLSLGQGERERITCQQALEAHSAIGVYVVATADTPAGKGLREIAELDACRAQYLSSLMGQCQRDIQQLTNKWTK